MKLSTKTLAIMTLLVSSVPAMASDLPRKRNIPVPTPKPVQVVEQSWQPYVGVNTGFSSPSVEQTVGGKVGVNTKYLRMEGAYDYLHQKGHLASASTLLQYQYGRFVPFVGVGVGKLWSSNGRDQNVWLGSVGSQYKLTQNLSLEGQYRYVNTFNNFTKPMHLTTFGVNYKF